ncbi:Predicted nucleic acid-binding protein, contains PIN domain [Cruoricaptor ignavus]|uniref:Predicted nucleic acid-binding protein, contains PIN domain n=1 Tax=Cruoricaptor ignavus TaxID=1118202 RepID=A0A1M6F5X4_9FLAO|nr:PIN domain-containing protein [Cruoricaptor ignavus]SHI93134.1 Predicted nucleic acid-binding protein, contains PIN domain [Cruoricaptor ignavus]
MNLVVDANIIFSALLNPSSDIGTMLLSFDAEYRLFAPEFIRTELSRYSEKIRKYSKLDDDELQLICREVFSTVNLISEDLISLESWKRAHHLLKEIDEDDTPFLALALELNTKIWTGDKRLLTELQDHTVSSRELLSGKF